MRRIRVHCPNLEERLLTQVLEAFYKIRGLPQIKKKPSTSEIIDWIQVEGVEVGLALHQQAAAQVVEAGEAGLVEVFVQGFRQGHPLGEGDFQAPAPQEGQKHYIEFPDKDLMADIVRVHCPNLEERLLTQVLEAFYKIRGPPGPSTR